MGKRINRILNRSRFCFGVSYRLSSNRKLRLLEFWFLTFGILFLNYAHVAQPGGIRDLSPQQRERISINLQHELDALSKRIRRNSRDIDLYRQRADIYSSLLKANYDNASWYTYANGYEKDLSRIIEFQPTAENFMRRGFFRSERLNRSDYKSNYKTKIRDLYPYNTHFAGAIADFAYSLKLTQSSEDMVGIYSSLSGVYAARPQKLASATNISKMQKHLPKQQILADFKNAIDNSLNALKAAGDSPLSDSLKSNVASIYLSNSRTASKFGFNEAALNFFEEGRKYLNEFSSSCRYYAEWAKLYLKLNDKVKASEKLNIIQSPDCDEYHEVKWKVY